MLYAAILSKGYEVSDHDAAQIALGYLLVPDEIEKEDLEILNQAHKIFEDEYVHYFEDAKKESHIIILLKARALPHVARLRASFSEWGHFYHFPY